MPIPNDAEFTGASVTEGAFKTALTTLLANLRGLLGTTGLAVDARTALGLGGTPVNYLSRGAWATTTVYAVNDFVTQGGVVYWCAIAHTAGTFATDLAAAKWVVMQGITAAQLIAASGSTLVSDAQSDSGATRSMRARAADMKLLTDYSTIAADGTDQTATIVTWLGTLASNKSAVYLAPWNCKFNAATVMAAMPTSVAILDLSGLNSYNGVGDVSKRVGLISKDEAANDTAWQIFSGHHAMLQLNNSGTAGSTSAGERAQTIIYSAGMYSAGTPGYREMASIALKRSTGNPYWEWNFNRLAPWAAVAANFERWAAGVAATSGVTYVINGSNFYVAASTGTTGGSQPVHAAGTVSDGGVSWTFVCTNSENVITFDQFGRLRTNGGVAATDLLSLKQRSDDPATSATATIQAAGTSKRVVLALVPTNGSAVATAQPTIVVSAANGLEVRKSDDSAALAAFTDAGGLLVNEFRLNHATKANNATTASVDGIGTLYCTDSAPTSVTDLTSADDDQIVRIVATQANTTLVHSSTFMLTGSINAPLTAWSSVTMQRVPGAISNRWVEVARSIK